MLRIQRRLRALQIIRDHPGLCATEFAPICWPNLLKGEGRFKPALKAAQWMGQLWKKGLLTRRYSSRFWEHDAEKPRAIYYLSAQGFEVLREYQERNSRTRYFRSDARRRERPVAH